MVAKQRSLAEVAADKLRLMIVQGRLDLGEKIREQDLADALGLSKTPIREALLRLAAEHLVVIRPRKGTFVFSTDPEDLEDLCALRIALEQAAIRHAMQRNYARLIAALERFGEPVDKILHEDRHDMNYYLKLDFEFHRTIMNLAKNPYLTDALSAIATKVQALRYRNYYSSFFVKRSLEDHNKLYEFMRNEDAEGACAFMDVHVRRIFEPENLKLLYM
ncbi:GntR family transcriptional regulator [uncultured delta proteobacterium]|uniref:GntR family transcriptional regulator n=1 Tax=uncultured delta proteobacterium TaxID=34034 RepID=A0A212IW96_9DELT|nr:GntR family transcriptional regulator [uncultured delta proteobacterium]